MHLLPYIEIIEGRQCHLKLSVIFCWMFWGKYVKIALSIWKFFNSVVCTPVNIWMVCYILALSLTAVKKLAKQHSFCTHSLRWIYENWFCIQPLLILTDIRIKVHFVFFISSLGKPYFLLKHHMKFHYFVNHILHCLF